MRAHVPESGWTPVRANGLTFACLVEGTGPLVVLIHGFPDTAHTWDAIRPQLAASGFRAAAPFTRGYAPTEIPASDAFDVLTLGRDVVGLIETLGGGEPAVVVGHDWGAAAAYAATALRPDLVAKLVTIAIPHPATLKPRLSTLWGARHFLTFRLPGAVRRFAADDFAMVDALYRRWSPTWAIPHGELEAAKNAFAAPGCANAALGYYRASSPVPPRELLARVNVPTLCFGGRDDGVLTEADFRAGARAFTGRYELVMTPGGHFLHREAPEAFAKPLLEFLRS